MQTWQRVPLVWLLALAALSAHAGPPARPIVRVNQQDGTRVLTPRFVRPAVAIDDDGGFSAVWTDETPQGQNLGVYARRFDSRGQPECGDIALEIAPKAGDVVLVGGAANGRFVVVWDAGNREGGVGRDAWFRVFDRRGKAVSEAKRANAFGAGNQGHGTVAMARDGHFVVAWCGDTSQKFSDEAVSVRVFDPTGEPRTGDIRVTPPGDRWPGDPAVSVGDDGAFVVAFTRGPQGGGESVYLQRFDPNAQPEGASFRVNVSQAGPHREESIALRRDRTVVVTWAGLNVETGDSAILLRLFARDGQPLTGEIRVDSGDAMLVGSPSLASAGDGTFAVAWSSHADNFSSRVLFRRFRADGSPAGAASDICAGEAGHHSLPSLSGNLRGDLVLVWSTILGDGESTSHQINSRVFPARF